MGQLSSVNLHPRYKDLQLLPSTGRVKLLGHGLDAFVAVRALSFDQSSNLLILDAHNNSVHAISKDGNFRLVVGGKFEREKEGTLSHPNGLASLQKGKQFFVSELSNQR